MIAAFFDVEGTLYKNQMWRGLVAYTKGHGRRLPVARYYALAMTGFALHKLRLVREETLRRLAIEKLGWLIAGWTVEDAAAAFDWIVHDYLLPTAHESVMVRLRSHLAQGHAVVLVSGMPLPCLEVVGRSLGVTGVVGTGLALRDGRYTGSIIPPVMIGDEKDRFTQKYLQERGIEVDWPASYAYADSVHDRSLLELVGHAVAVFPDDGLRELATVRGWEIMA